MANAGKVLMLPKGAWVSGQDYSILDVVYDGGSSYVAKSDIVNSTIRPVNDATHWQLLVQGVTGDGSIELIRGMQYEVGTVAKAATAPSWAELVCVTAGTTAMSEPAAYSSITVAGGVIADGTASFMVKDMRADVNICSGETSPAIAAHAVGEALIYNGRLYRVTAPIAAGGALTPDTNITQITVMSEMKSINSAGIFLVEATEWTLDSETNLYEYTLQATAIYSPTPDICLSGATVGAQATTDEEKAFGCLTATGHYAETSDNTVHLYASKAPTVDFYVMIKGVA